MNKQDYLCVDCFHVITNPICSDCFSKHIIAWIEDNKPTPYQRNKIKNLLENFIIKTETPSNMGCVICGLEKVNLCTFCFTKNASQIIKNSLKDNSILEKFDEDFNAGIWERA